MAELPEIVILARQMDQHLAGLKLVSLDLGQPKSLNVPPQVFEERLMGRRLERVRPHGKWLILEFALPGPNLLIHPGMGLDLLALEVKPAKPPQFRFIFGQGRGFSIRFWWFGYLRLAEPGQELKTAGGLGPAPLSPGFCPADLDRLVDLSPRSRLKSFLTNQKNLAGIGNVYVQDICFRIRAHPLTRLGDLQPSQKAGLWPAIEETLSSAIERGINYFESDLWGRQGDWGREAFLVGYKAGQPCPSCGRPIEKIRACSSASYVCPHCQPEVESP